MPWRIIEVSASDATPADLTDSQLIGISVYLADDLRKGYPEGGVYQDAYYKLQPFVEVALSHEGSTGGM